MSGNDLVPFVAATLRDKVVAEAAEENKQLREEIQRQRHEIQQLKEMRHGTPIMELIHSQSGDVYMTGEFERGSCLDTETSGCFIRREENDALTLSQLLQCSLRVSGETWYALDDPFPHIEYAEWSRPEREHIRVMILFGDNEDNSVDVKVFMPIATAAEREALLTFIGRPESEEEFLDGLHVNVNHFISSYGHLSIDNAQVWVPAKDMIMRGPQND